MAVSVTDARITVRLISERTPTVARSDYCTISEPHAAVLHKVHRDPVVLRRTSLERNPADITGKLHQRDRHAAAPDVLSAGWLPCRPTRVQQKRLGRNLAAVRVAAVDVPASSGVGCPNDALNRILQLDGGFRQRALHKIRVPLGDNDRHWRLYGVGPMCPVFSRGDC